MLPIPFFLLIVAFGLFIAAMFNLPSKINLVAAGLAAWVLSMLIH